MTAIVNPNAISGKAISRGRVPAQARSLQVPLLFSASASIQATLPIFQHPKNVQQIDFVQSIYIDNYNNGANVDITFSNGYHLSCPAYAEAIFPIFAASEVLNFIATSTGGVDINVLFLNTLELQTIWTTKIPIAGTVNVSGSDVFTQPFTGSFTDVSSALAAGGTAQQLVAANGARQIIAVRNPATPTSQNIGGGLEPVYLKFGAGNPSPGDLGTWELLPGEALPQFLMTSTQAIQWVAATTGHRLTAYYM